MMSFELLVGLRYLRPKRHGSLAALIALIAMLGVFLGVATLIIVISVMNGFEQDLEEKILGTNAHIKIFSYAGATVPYPERVRSIVEAVPGVIAAAPVAESEVLIKSRDRVVGVKLRGVVPELEQRVTEFADYVAAGAGAYEFPEENSIILGAEMSRYLGVGLGDEVMIVAPDMKLTPLGMTPTMVRVRVAGIFRSGMNEYDNILALAPLSLVAKLLGNGSGPTAMEVKIEDILAANRIAEQIREKVEYQLVVRSWQQINHSLFSAIQLEKVVMFIILTLIIFVAAFNVAGSLVMMVAEKTKEIGILRSLGTSPAAVMRIFFLQGLVIGLGGIILGGLTGGAVCYYLAEFGLTLPSDVYYIDKLPVDAQAGDIAIIIAGTLLITLLAGVYPAWRASRLDPVAAIRVE